MEIGPSQHMYPLSRAIANLKLERWREAKADTKAGLKLASSNLEAAFTEGLARKGLCPWSHQDTQACLDLGGWLIGGREVVDAITHLEEAATSNPISDRFNDSSEVLDTFPLDDDSGFAIRDSKIGGKGVFATRDFKRGDVILCERQLVILPMLSDDILVDMETEVRKMSPESLARLLSLHNSHDGTCCLIPDRATQLIFSNVLAFGVGFWASRINHSCSPNARHSFHDATGKLRIHALGPIREGEEVFAMCRESRQMFGTPRAGRQEAIRLWYHVSCACAVCTLPADDTQASDARRVRLAELMGSTAQSGPMGGAARLRAIVEGVHLLREEGFLADADSFTDGADAVCAFHSDWASAKYWAGVTYQTRVDEFGEGNWQAEEAREHFLHPMSIPMAGLGPQEDFSGIRLD